MNLSPATQRILEALTDANLFKTFAPPDLAACAGKCRQTSFAKGELLFARGDPGAYLCVVVEGQVRLAISTSEGRELSFEIVGPGALFGEIAALDGQARSADATALAATKAIVLDRADFNRLRSERPGVSEAVVTFLCARLRNVSDKLEAIALYPLEVRLARFLLVAIGDRRAPAGRRVPLELRYSQGELALLLGASRPKINAALGSLEAAGALGRTSDRLFCDRDKLSRIADLLGERGPD
jgi:CRP/FNR family transcriptional regulator, cyclic AMP receptor protein